MLADTAINYDSELEQGVAALLHEPFGGAGGSADANGLYALQPFGAYLLGPLDEMGAGIHAQTLIKKYLAVAALATTDKEDEVVTGGKLRDAGHAVGHLTADGVEAAEGGFGRDVGRDIVDDAVELIERLGGLRVQVDVVREVELLHVLELLDDNGLALGLPHESQYFGVSVLAEDDDGGSGSPYVSRGCFVLSLDAVLQLEDHGAGSIDDLDVVALCQLVGLGRFAVCSQEHLRIVQLVEVVVVDGDKPHLPQALALHAVVNDVAQAVESAALREFLLGLADGGGDAEAEATTAVDFYLHVAYFLLSSSK